MNFEIMPEIGEERHRVCVSLLQLYDQDKQVALQLEFNLNFSVVVTLAVVTNSVPMVSKDLEKNHELPIIFGGSPAL